MPYTLRKTNGTTLAIIQDGAIETSTDLVFVGKNYAGYGQTVNENFLKLLENFSGSREPGSPISGQTWFDTSSLKLKVFDGTRFKSLTITEVDNKRPSDLRIGDQWFDSVDQKLYVYNGQDFIMIGPEKAAKALQSQISGAIVPANDSNSYTVLQASIDTGTDSVIAAFSKDTFTPHPSSDYFTNQHFNNVRRGISLPYYDVAVGTRDLNVRGAVPTNVNLAPVFFGAASSAWGLLELNSGVATFYDAKEYIRRTTNDSLVLNGEIVTSSNDGVTVGPTGCIKLHVDTRIGNEIGNLSNMIRSRINFNVTTEANSLTNVIALDYANNSLAVIPNVQLGTPAIGPTNIPVDLGTNTNAFRNANINTVYTHKISTSTSGVIEGVWTLSYGSRIEGGSVQASSAVSATNATLLQSFDNASYVHAQTATNALSIVQRDAISRVWTSGIVSPGSSYFYGSWQVATGATVQSTALLGSDSVGYIGASSANSNNTIVQRTSSGAVNAASVVTQSIKAGTLESSAGTITGQWTLVGTSTLEATYADIAERYEADAEYEPGTVLVVGGVKEVTTTVLHADTRAAGIVSTNPAFKLNAGAGNDSTHPYIALKGRVPCKVTGIIKKGERLVSSQKLGFAEAFRPLDDPGAVIGIALEDKNSEVDGLIQVLVK